MSVNCKDLKKIFWISIITRPIPNSTADKTKKKKVNDNRLILSLKKPILNTMIYNVIQRSSAVNSKCNAFETLLEILTNNKKNKIKYKLASPINIKYKRLGHG